MALAPEGHMQLPPEEGYEAASSHMGREKPRSLGLFWATHASQQCRVAAFPEGIATAPADGKRSKTSAKIVARVVLALHVNRNQCLVPELREVEPKWTHIRPRISISTSFQFADSPGLCATLFFETFGYFISFHSISTHSVGVASPHQPMVTIPLENIRRGGQESVAVEKRRRQFFKYTVHYTCPERGLWSIVCMQKCASTRAANTYRVLIARVWF